MGAPVLAMLALVGVAGWKWLTRNGQKGVHETGPAKHESAVSVARGGKSEAATVVESSSEEQRRPERKSPLFEVHPGNRNAPATGTLYHLTLQFCSEHCKLFSPSSLLSSSPSSPSSLLSSSPSSPSSHHPSSPSSRDHSKEGIDSRLPNAPRPSVSQQTAALTHDAESPFSSSGSKPPVRKYPTASSDLPLESLSELESFTSNEDLPFLPPKSPAVYDTSSNPSPSLDNHALHLVGKPVQKGFSTTVPGFNSEPQSPISDASPQDFSFKRTPTLPKPGSRDRIKVTVQIPKDLVGRFIGKQGRNIKSLMVDSDGAHVYLNQKNLPKDAATVPCYIQGSSSQVNQALKIVEVKFPDIEIPNQLDSVPFSPRSLASPSFSPQSSEEMWTAELKPAVIPSSPFYAMVSYIESLDCVWLVPYYDAGTDHLDDLHQSMSYMYCYATVVGSDIGHVEEGDESVVGKYCAVKVSDIHWLRGHLTRLSDDRGNYEVQLVDYGSSVIVPATSIKPLRSVCVLWGGCGLS